MDHYLNLVLLLQTSQTSSSFSNGIQLVFFLLNLNYVCMVIHDDTTKKMWFFNDSLDRLVSIDVMFFCAKVHPWHQSLVSPLLAGIIPGVYSAFSPFLCSEQKMFFVGQISANYFWFFFLHESVCSWADLVWPVLHTQLIERFFSIPCQTTGIHSLNSKTQFVSHFPIGRVFEYI